MAAPEVNSGALYGDQRFGRTVKRRAKISKYYRYALWREWNARKPQVLFVMFNPSTADHLQDDPTTKKCIRFAKKWGCGRVVVVNLFAFRTSSPKELKHCVAPIGPKNDRWIRKLSKQSDLIVVAWGNNGVFGDRDKRVAAMLARPKCLGLTKRGFPRHPLYVPFRRTAPHFRCIT